MNLLLNRQICKRARLARDVRFDGRFFTAVKTTGIYCRSVCPASPPLEKNVEYYDSAISAAQAGFRPCLRCRPDSAPGSWPWLGAQSTFQRALDLIHAGVLQSATVVQLSHRLGISDRYLRDLFQKNLGTSPRKYAIYQQCLFAKKLLHETNLSITNVAYASGFNSVRRFNEALRQQIGLTPREIRNSNKSVANGLVLKLYYRPPYAWRLLHEFYANRLIPGLEWIDGDQYSRTIRYGDTRGYFSIAPNPDRHNLNLILHLNEYQNLNSITQRVKMLFDVDAPIDRIDSQLEPIVGKVLRYHTGLRIPGTWSIFEAGVRAILGQQVSVFQARKLVLAMVENLGDGITFPGLSERRLFPKPEIIIDNSLAFFRMPQARKDTLRRLAEHMLTAKDPNDVDQWSAIKGIGPWTVNYVKLRAVKAPDIWMAGDAGLKNALQQTGLNIDLAAARPWLSYLTFQLWSQL